MSSCPAACGIRCVKPSSATVSPSRTSSATASAPLDVHPASDRDRAPTGSTLHAWRRQQRNGGDLLRSRRHAVCPGRRSLRRGGRESDARKLCERSGGARLQLLGRRRASGRTAHRRCRLRHLPADRRHRIGLHPRSGLVGRRVCNGGRESVPDSGIDASHRAQDHRCCRCGERGVDACPRTDRDDAPREHRGVRATPRAVRRLAVGVRFRCDPRRITGWEDKRCRGCGT